jgi:SAM-dependent methyltransferase
VTLRERWLAAMWPTVRAALPASPAVVVEIGCGSQGGFVPELRDAGYHAIGIDPEAPEGADFRRAEFERYELPGPVDAVVACTSLHHVHEPAAALEKVARSVGDGGVVIVVEWDWESFDEATARWCFDRLGSSQPGWLHRLRDGWLESRQSWDDYLRGWAQRHGVHSGQHVLRELDDRFDRLVLRRGPYFFTDLAATSEADELNAIETGAICATRIDYVGRINRGHSAITA